MKKQDIFLPSSMLLDPNAEPLHQILSSYRGVTHVPSELAGPGLMVFVELQKCFQKAGKVCEGLLPNVIWGFQQCGFDPRHVAAGLTELRTKDYIFYSDAGRLPVSEVEYATNKQRQVWIRYTKKFQDLLVKDDAANKPLGLIL